MLDENYAQPICPIPEEILIQKRKNIQNLGSFNKLQSLVKFLGPAFIVSVAYIDPGNFATNISGGSKFNYTLIWVILWSNLMAIFLQTLSAKLGIATGHSLPTMCGKVFSKRTNWCFWIVAEFGAMATNLADSLKPSIFSAAEIF